jgi:hypothetical protein
VDPVCQFDQFDAWKLVLFAFDLPRRLSGKENVAGRAGNARMAEQRPAASNRLAFPNGTDGPHHGACVTYIDAEPKFKGGATRFAVPFIMSAAHSRAASTLPLSDSNVTNTIVALYSTI